jgi:hyaluronate lyase
MMQGVNNRGWYQGDGALFISLPDHLRFNDGFWPTVDPYRLPGITVDTRPRKDGDTGPANQGHVQLNTWAGGAVLDRNAVAGMELAPPDITLRARKSWFFIGDRIVCLGAGIGSGDGRVIETVVENAKLAADGGNVLNIDGKAAPAELGWSGQADAASWVHLAGVTPASDCGWVFAAGAKTLRLKREARTGSWVKLFTKDDVTPLTRNYLTMWFDHGSSPRDAGYAYTILPGAGAAQVAAYAAKPEIAIAANTPAIQAVTAAGLRAANFWTAAGGTVCGITASGQAAVLVEDGPAGLAIAIADPSQLAARVELTIASAAGAPTFCDPAITVAERSPVRLTVDLAGSDGRSLVVRFAR